MTDARAEPSPGPSAGRHADHALLDVIAASLPRLSKSERKVAETVLAAPGKVPGSAMAELARAAGVSEPTVMRFCLAVGCSGFADFKLRLARTLAFGTPATHSVIAPGDDVDSVIGKIFSFTLSSLDHARHRLDAAEIERAVDALASAREIMFVGLGASGIVAEDAQQKFPLFRAPCSAPVDAHQQFVAAAVADPGLVVVAISNTGRTRSVIDVASLAQRHGAVVIGIAGARGPLFDHCDIALCVETLENTDLYTPTISRLAALVIIDILATGVAMRHDPEYIERVRHMKAGLAAMRAGAPFAEAFGGLEPAAGEAAEPQVG